jgi:HD-like signal output (HDOD) protein
MPVFSPVLGRLVATLGDETISFTHLAALIEKDTLLAGHLLRLVNSAIYSRGREVTSVPRAISILGVTRLRNFAVSLLVARMWSRVRLPQSFSLARFNLHGVATAIAADLLAQRIPVEYYEGAFAAGLLHDVGKALVAVSLPEEYDLLARSGAWDAGMEEEVLGVSHAELSRQVLEHWRLPPPICQAAGEHHTPPSGPPSLGHIVHAANLFANATSAATEAGAPLDPAAFLAPLGLQKQFESIQSSFAAEFDTLRQFF